MNSIAGWKSFSLESTVAPALQHVSKIDYKCSKNINNEIV